MKIAKKKNLKNKGFIKNKQQGPVNKIKATFFKNKKGYNYRHSRKSQNIKKGKISENKENKAK